MSKSNRSANADSTDNADNRDDADNVNNGNGVHGAVAEIAGGVGRPIASAPRSQDSGVLARASLVVVLSLTLVGSMRWALNITNANARQISKNLTRMQGQYDTQAQASARKTQEFPPRRSGFGPVIEPVIEPDSR